MTSHLMDEKLQSVLGHLRKYFEGGVENLGATCGQYGSFLLEESEASDDDHDDTSIKHDIAESYIDERLQSVLGHFQKDFEGGAEIVGSTYGAYGSFLPIYRRRLHSSRAQPKDSQSVEMNITQSPYNLHKEEEATFRKRDEAAEKLPSPKKSLSSPDQKNLRCIKSNKAAQKNVAIYQALGLDSPSTSSGNSTGESWGIPVESRENPDKSPTPILQMLSTLTVPLEPLLSPLPDRLTNLLRDISSEGKSILALKDSRPKQGSSDESPKQQSCSIDINYGSLRNSSTVVCKEPVKHNLVKNRKRAKNTIKGSLLCADDAVKENYFELVSDQCGSKLKHQEKKASKKDVSRSRELYEDLFDESEAVGRTRLMDPLQKLGSIDTKCENLDRFKVKSRPNKVDHQQTCQSSVKKNIDYWVLCDRCEQWRLLPNGKTPDQLPDTWFCSMLNWLPGMNSCKFTEDETTEAVRANQYNAHRAVTGVSSVGTLYNNLESKKHKVKETTSQKDSKSVLKTTSIRRKDVQGPVRQENLNAKHSDSGMKVISNLISQQLSSSGEAKLKRNSKRVSDQLVHPTAKKVKTEFGLQQHVRCH